MSDVSDHVRQLSLLLLNFHNTVNTCSRSCRDEVFDALKVDFIDPQMQAQERLLNACPNLIEAVNRAQIVLRESGQ